MVPSLWPFFALAAGIIALLVGGVGFLVGTFEIKVLIPGGLLTLIGVMGFLKLLFTENSQKGIPVRRSPKTR